MRILVVRNDRLGDFMLAWPAFAILKHYWPEAIVHALVPEYTADIAELCPWIDDIVIDRGSSAIPLSKELAGHRYDVLLTLFSTNRVAWAGLLSRIPYRLAPATKLFQFLYNHRLTQRRSRSEKPEYAYNIDLVYQLLWDLRRETHDFTTQISPDNYLPASIKLPLLSFPGSEAKELHEKLCNKYNIPPDAKLVFIHPGSGGSANNLTPQQYIALANQLQCNQPITCIITAGPGEERVASMIATGITNHPAICLRSEGGIVQLARYLQLADMFISCSTGPLHLAGALDRPTAAFYPRHRSGSPLRWQTLNSTEKRLSFVPPSYASEKSVSSIDIYAAADRISRQISE